MEPLRLVHTELRCSRRKFNNDQPAGSAYPPRAAQGPPARHDDELTRSVLITPIDDFVDKFLDAQGRSEVSPTGS